MYTNELTVLKSFCPRSWGKFFCSDEMIWDISIYTYICIFLVLTSYSSRSWPVNYILSLCIYLFVSTYEHDYIKLDLRSKLTVSLLYVITSLGQYWRMAWHISPECLGWAGPSPHPMCDRGPAWLSRTLLSSVTVDTGLGGWGHLFVQLGKYLVNIS